SPRYAPAMVRCRDDDCDSDTTIERYPPARRHVSRQGCAQSSTLRLPRAWPADSQFSVQQILQRRLVELRFGQQALELAILLLELLQPASLRYRHASVLRFPV